MQNPSDDEDDYETNTINVVPLADLSLVLLIVIMILSPSVMQSMIKVQAPRLDKQKVSQDKTPDPLLIRITAKGFFLNNNPIDSEEFLAEQIALKLRKEPDRAVIVVADDMIRVGDVVHVLDLAKQNGAEKVSLMKGDRG